MIPKKVCKHDFVLEIPRFFDLSDKEQSSTMSVCKCLCRLTGWWTRISLDDTHRGDYPAFRCNDCKRVAVVNPYDCTPKEYTIGV